MKNNIIPFPNKIPPENEGDQATQISEVSEQLRINPGEVLDSYLEAQSKMGTPEANELKASLRGLLRDFNSRLQQ